MAITLTSNDDTLLTQIARDSMRTAISQKEQWFACLGITDKLLPNTVTSTIPLTGPDAPTSLLWLADRIAGSCLVCFDENFNSSTGLTTPFYCTYPTVWVDEVANEVKVSIGFVAPTEAQLRAGTWAPST